MSHGASSNSIGLSASRFLGVEATADQPAKLLGLRDDPRSWQAAEIGRALVGQLHRIDEHPQARTPEADELRVALHVAAAQLKDPSVRARLLGESSHAGESGTGMVTGEGASDPLRAPMPTDALTNAEPVRPPACEPVSIDPGFVTAAQHVLASCGGWNAESKRLLGYLARSASVDASILQRALVDITRQHEQGSLPSTRDPLGLPASASAATPNDHAYSLSRSTSADRQLDHRIASPRARAWITIGTFLMLAASITIGLGLATVIVQEALRTAPPITTRVVGPSPSTSSGGPSPSNSDLNSTESADSVADADSTMPLQADGPRLVRFLQGLTVEAFDAAPNESFAGLSEAIDRLARAWPALAPEVRSIAPLAVRDAILAASEADPERASNVIQALRVRLDVFDPNAGLPASDAIPGSVFAFGVAGLLLDTPIEPRLERTLRSELNSIASTVGLGLTVRDFESLAAIALTALAEAGIPRAADSSAPRTKAYWSALLRVADSLEAKRARSIQLAAIEAIVERGEDPTFHRPTSVALESLVGSMDWRAADASELGERLLAWFDDRERITDEALRVITAALVDGAYLPMLGAEMKLGESASPDARRALRDRYAVRFGLPQVGDGRLFVAEWAGFAEEQLDSSIAQADRDALDAAVRAAFLNASAALWLDSNEDAARANLANVRNGLSGFVASAGGPVSFGAQRTPRADGEWAARYLRARRSADDRTRLLYELENTGGPAGAADADVLAEAASYSTPIEVRRQAQQIVVTYSGKPEVILGLLEVLPRAAAQSGVSDMIADATGRSLPDVEDQDWEFEARRALVARSLELLAREDRRFLDIARTALERAVVIRLDALPAPPARPGPDTFSGGGIDSIGIADDSDSVPVMESYVERLLALCRRYPQRSQAFATLTELESRRRWRDRLATGAIAEFVSGSTSSLELLAYATTAERPADAERIGDIIEEAASARRIATSAWVQIAVNERAMLRLNMIRLGAMR